MKFSKHGRVSHVTVTKRFSRRNVDRRILKHADVEVSRFDEFGTREGISLMNKSFAFFKGSLLLSLSSSLSFFCSSPRFLSNAWLERNSRASKDKEESTNEKEKERENFDFSWKNIQFFFREFANRTCSFKWLLAILNYEDHSEFFARSCENWKIRTKFNYKFYISTENGS